MTWVKEAPLSDGWSENSVLVGASPWETSTCSLAESLATVGIAVVGCTVVGRVHTSWVETGVL